MARKLNQQPQGGTGGDGRSLSPSDNMTDAEKRRLREESDQVQLVSGISRYLPMRDKVAVIQAQLKEAQTEAKNFKKVLCGSINMNAEVFDEIIADQTSGNRRDVLAREEARAYFRRLMGQPVGRSEEQMELDSRLPPTERDKEHYRGSGYSVGLRGGDCVVPEDVSGAQDMQQAWIQGWHDGQAVNIMALKKTSEAAKPPEPPPEPEKEESPYMRKKREKAEQEKLLASLEKQADEIIEDAEEPSTEFEHPEPDFV